MFVLLVDFSGLNQHFYETFETVEFSIGVAQVRRPLLFQKLSGCHIPDSQHCMEAQHDPCKDNSWRTWKYEEDYAHGVDGQALSKLLWIL